MLQRARFILIFTGVSAVFLSWGLMQSLLPPIYPREAEARGATAFEYGLVFGIPYLAAFFLSPVFGECGDRIGPRRLYGFAYLFESMTGGITFSLLANIQDSSIFIGLSLLLRFLCGAAGAAASGAVLGMVTKHLPEKANTLVALTESFFGLGYMIGPAIGSFLYRAGGFSVPFLTAGITSFSAGTFLFFSIPKSEESSKDSLKDKNHPRLKTLQVLQMVGALLAWLDNVIAMLSNGFLESMLEPHARTAVGMSITEVGFTFLAAGFSYLLSSPIFGHICDKYPSPGKLALVSLVGNAIMAICDLTIGPVTFLSMILTPSRYQIMAICAIGGIGEAMLVISTYARLSTAVQQAGYCMDANTTMVISGVWYSSYNFGAFAGPMISGSLVEWLGFSDTGLMFATLHLVMTTFNLSLIFWHLPQLSHYKILN